jgi:hypothetical protein
LSGPVEIHPNLALLAPLVGRWEGRGRGFYPTIDDFEYLETSEWGHAGKPFLSYRQATRSPAGSPLHSEAGFWRVPAAPDLEVVMSQPFGAVEISSGTFSPTTGGLVITMATTSVLTTPTAKTVTEVTRRYELAGDALTYHVRMAAVGQALVGHLDATLYRAE